MGGHERTSDIENTKRNRWTVMSGLSGKTLVV